MTNMRVAKSRKPRRAGSSPRPTPGAGGIPASLLDPLAPLDTFAPLATERLILRPLLPEDAEALNRLVNDWEVARSLTVVPFPYPRELADQWILSTRNELARGTAYHLAITGR